MKYDYLIVGAGFAGSVMAERLASQLNKKILLVEKRNHTGGNAFDEYDDHGILVHRYGPHIFHTNSRIVFDYLSQFTKWRKYEHVVRANYRNVLYPIPVNRKTINMFYKLNLGSVKETADYLENLREKRHPVVNSEDLIVNQVGSELFRAFFEKYTFKQWNKMPNELNASVCGRIPVRFNDDERYFTDKYQFMPAEGYTKMFNNMLRNINIEIVLNTDYREILNDVQFGRMIYTGPIDSFFNDRFGKLPYRSIWFEYVHHESEYFQEYAQINFVDDTVQYTRVVEHKYLSGQRANGTTITREYPQFSGEPYYPIPTEENRKLFRRYQKEAEKLKSVSFCGRLAEYQYYNMDQVIANTLKRFGEIAHGK